MPALVPIALRYLLWLVGLRVLFVALTALTGLPNTLATGVLLAAVPAVEIALYTNRTAQGTVTLAGWGAIWGVMFAVYLAVMVVIPAAFVPQFRQALVDGAGLNSLLILAASTAVMMALFLWVGVRAGKRQ